MADDRSPFALEKVTFEDTVTKPRLIALGACAQSSVGGGGGGRQTPWLSEGNFVRKSWCAGSGARDGCQIAESSHDDRDPDAVQLG